MRVIHTYAAMNIHVYTLHMYVDTCTRNRDVHACIHTCMRAYT